MIIRPLGRWKLPGVPGVACTGLAAAGATSRVKAPAFARDDVGAALRFMLLTAPPYERDFSQLEIDAEHELTWREFVMERVSRYVESSMEPPPCSSEASEPDASGSERDAEQRRWGRLFAIASLLTPVLLGISIGAIAAGGVGEAMRLDHARGASSFLTKSTKWLAITFFALTLFIAV